MSPSEPRASTRPLDAAFMPPEPADLSGTVLMGRYRLGALIARGGMGSVYMAEQLILHGRFAVKVLSPRYAHEAEFVARFLQEARAASQIGHPNIVQIIDFGREGDIVFMVMEYLPGADLGRLLRDLGAPLGWPRLARIVLQLCSALDAAHKAGLVHRDIKPGNCVCTVLADGSDLVKVVDFGIAKALEGANLADQHGEQPHTITGVHMGTLDYMAPEIFVGAAPNPQFDVYSLGVLIYKMLTGAVPFPGARPELVHTLDRSNPPAPSAHPRCGDLPRDVDAIVLRALAADPTQRYASMSELAADVERSLVQVPAEPTTQVRVWPETSHEESPTPAGRESSVDRVVVPKRRRPWGPVAGLVMLAGIIGIGANYWSSVVSTGTTPDPEQEIVDEPPVKAQRSIQETPVTPVTAPIADTAATPASKGPDVPPTSADPAPPPPTTSTRTDEAPNDASQPLSVPAPLRERPSKAAVEAAIKNTPGLKRCGRTDPVDVEFDIKVFPTGQAHVTKQPGKGYESEGCALKALGRGLRIDESRQGGAYKCLVEISGDPLSVKPTCY